MMDHNEERRHISHWAVCQHNIVKHLREFWELDYTEEEINHVIGLIEVNAFEIKLRQKTKEGDISELGLWFVVCSILDDSAGVLDRDKV